MKALIIGSGAREHALVWKFSRSKRISGLYAVPGNEGTAELSENLGHINPSDPKEIIDECLSRKIDLVFIGPETPIAEGLSDRIEAAGISVINPSQAAAQLESSKVFSKSFMQKHHIPTAEAVRFDDAEEFLDYIAETDKKVVIKKNGLAAGKGVFESDDKDALLQFGENILKQDSLLVEEYLEGYEISIFALFDGKHYVLFPPCADFKKAGENDTGLNTGGMGAICPVPGVSSSLLKQIRIEIVEPTFQGIQKDGLAYRGFLYFGLMITENGPKLLEYNVRLGDPETQVLLPLIDSDFCNLMDAVIEQKLDQFPLRVSSRSAVGVVIASGGYPGEYKKGIHVHHIPQPSEKRSLIFHASTMKNQNGEILTQGGRCFTVVGLHEEIHQAQQIAYETALGIEFEGAWYRNDIGNKFFF